MPKNEKGEWITTKDVNIEVFKFEYIPEEFDWEDIRYNISLGQKSYNSFISDWSNDWEYKRHDMENLIFHQKTEINLHNDDSPTCLILEIYKVLDKELEKKRGTGFAWISLMKIELIPDEFAGRTQKGFVGYADYYETINELYQGLLRATFAYPNENNDGMERLVAYNKMKSPLLETYIKKESFERYKANNRQQHINEILTICPDWGCYIWDNENEGTDVSSFEDCEGNKIVMEEFDEWASEIVDIVIASETGLPYTKDWADYHRRGIALAKQLREKLPSDIDLWYEAPFEDKSGTIPRKILIM